LAWPRGQGLANPDIFDSPSGRRGLEFLNNTLQNFCGNDSADRNDACRLMTSTEVGVVIGGAANVDTPAALPGASGCEYRPDGLGNQPYLDVIYAQADSNGLYVTLLAGATQETGNATPSVSDVGDKAFTFTGQNGPGIVVLKADKVVILEFSYTNPGENALLTLARQAAARVH
jgi:hypothetical protein